MEEGAIPPPRRSQPRSLTGPPRQHGNRSSSSQLSAPPTNQPGPFGQLSRDEEIMELRHIVTRERKEREKIQNSLRDEISRMDRAMNQYRQMEEELVSKDAMVDTLSAELRQLKQKKQSVESELAQATADYMNGQNNWLEQVSNLNDEILALKGKLQQSQEKEKLSVEELNAYRETEIQSTKSQRSDSLPQDSKNVQVAADALERHQNELLIKELRAFHSKLKDEMQELKEMNERLRDDNEHYQYLLVENTITGKFDQLHTRERTNSQDRGSSTVSSSRNASVSLSGPQDGSLNGTGLTLADDEILYDMDHSKSMTKDLSLEDEDSMTSMDSADSLRKTINQQQFELRSLHNYNRALRLSLERLVDRLLDNKNFSRAVEETVSSATVRSFRSRVASYSSGEPALSTGSTSSTGSPVKQRTGAPPAPSNASVWTDMIVNTHYTGAPNRRVISLGVDNEFVSPPQPTASPAAKTDGVETSVSSGLSKPGMRYIFGHPKSSSPAHSTLVSPSRNKSEIHVAKRAESLTSLRKLKLTE